MLSMMITMSIILLYLNHPLSMGLILIIQTLITAMIIGYMMSSFLFSYIIIIIMLSGALVLFIYMASIASNEKFKSPITMIIMSVMIMMMTFMFMVFNNNLFMANNISMNEITSIIKIFNTLTAQITMMMIMYLLLTMIAVSNIASVTYGPLRMKK
uniref:NADH-ubiquinone oxidoreductase chain 6 n=2 Tax=Chinavia TaxID=1497371 RepID=A0A343YVA6_9HEMI|nr:NADH dehydrogenase subunit 6 [Chinavia impicticornis]AWN56189.1 NADH dehydrogenase subunit 6 [Chinavia ubica]